MSNKTRINKNNTDLSNINDTISNLPTYENIAPEIAEQIQLLQIAQEGLVGKATGADAVAADIVKGKTAYVGQQLVMGTLEIPKYDNLDTIAFGGV